MIQQSSFFQTEKKVKNMASGWASPFPLGFRQTESHKRQT
jgi:hypothetical protein